MALTTRTFKGHLAMDSADGSVEVWLVVKPHWRETLESYCRFLPPNHFICHFFYRANTPVTKHVRLEDRPDRNELLLVEGALIVSETQLQSLIEAGNFVRLPRTKVLSFAQFCRVVAAKARVSAGNMTVTDFYDQLHFCMLADHADVVINNSVIIYFWRKSFTHPRLTNPSAKYQGSVIPDADWPLPAFRRADSKLLMKAEQLPKSKVSSASLNAKSKRMAVFCLNKASSSTSREVKEESLVSPSTETTNTKKVIKLKTEPNESAAKKEQPKNVSRKRSGSQLVDTAAAKRRHVSTQTQSAKPKQSHQSTQTAAVAVDSSMGSFAPIQAITSTLAPSPLMPQRMTAAMFLSHLSALEANVSNALPFPPFPLSTPPWTVAGDDSGFTTMNSLRPALFNAGVVGIRENGDVEVAAPEEVIRLLGDTLAPLPSAS
uniref:Uncharacterized protein n=1 Tax=Plectus sambesii TaxID=2011161 RepID=A0A914URC1_9BILA